MGKRYNSKKHRPNVTRTDPKLLALTLVFVLFVVLFSSGDGSCIDIDESFGDIGIGSQQWNYFDTHTSTVYGTEIEFDEAQGYFCCVDVDQADCLLLVSGDDCVVIDAGNAGYGEDISELMLRLGIEDIDMLICTHPHADHIGSADELMELFDTELLVYTSTPDGFEYDSKQWSSVLETAQSNGVDEKVVYAGEVLQVGDIKLTVLSPFSDEAYTDVNDFSIALFIEMYGVAIFTGGDITDGVEENLLGAYPWLYADILKISHHGSGGANSRVFVRALNPSYACISCGKNNSYGHPHERVTELLSELGIQTNRTDYDGNIFYLIKDGSICVKTENAA